jgi:hypothetical protein
MKPRELAICLDILGGGQLDCALAEHVENICQNVLATTFTINVKGELVASYDHGTKVWTPSDKLTRVLTGLGLISPDGVFDESKAQELHPDFEGQWGTPSSPDQTGWEMPKLSSKTIQSGV